MCGNLDCVKVADLIPVTEVCRVCSDAAECFNIHYPPFFFL